jgi:shikimate kinase
VIDPSKRHLYIAGFMGTGKSASGRIVAERLRRAFYDLDLLIEEMTHRTIVSIFETEGEPAFRLYEWRALRSIVGSAGAVIALGGGAPTVSAIAALVKSTGRTVLLTADWPTIWERVRHSASRPLLVPVTMPRAGAEDGDFDGFVAHASGILERRRSVYDQLADITVDSSGLTPEHTAGRILEALTIVAAI